MAGHRGLVGSALWRELERRGYRQLSGRTRQELDLLDTKAVDHFYSEVKPEFVFVAAAKVGGILANLGTGYIVQHFSYRPIFLMAGLMHPLSIVLVYWLLPNRYFRGDHDGGRLDAIEVA